MTASTYGTARGIDRCRGVRNISAPCHRVESSGSRRRRHPRTARPGGKSSCTYGCCWQSVSHLSTRNRGRPDVPAFQRLATRQTAVDFVKATRLVRNDLLAANACLVHKKGTLGTRDRIGVAVVLDLWVATQPGPSAVVSALWRACPAGLRRLEDGPPARTADFIKYCFGAGVAWSLVAQLLAGVLPTLQSPAAYAKADVFRLKVLVRDGVQILLPLRRLSLCGPLLTRTADATTFVPSAVQLCPADTAAFSAFDLSQVAGGLCRCPAAAARDADSL